MCYAIAYIKPKKRIISLEIFSTLNNRTLRDLIKKKKLSKITLMVVDKMKNKGF